LGAAEREGRKIGFSPNITLVEWDQTFCMPEFTSLMWWLEPLEGGVRPNPAQSEGDSATNLPLLGSLALLWSPLPSPSGSSLRHKTPVVLMQGCRG
jgi:hypothetical protein